MRDYRGVGGKGGSFFDLLIFLMNDMRVFTKEIGIKVM